MNIYAPNVDRCSCQFFENLQGHLLEFGISDEDNIIIGGDFNRPFYSCVLSDLPLDWKRGWG